MYFICTYFFVNYALFIDHQPKLFEVGYPAHPYIFEKRSQVINALCHYHPQILKNEIEYLHRKIYQLDEQTTVTENNTNKYEREFVINGGKRLRFIVDDGQVFLQCIDKFEDIFEVSREILGKELELTEILDPSMFDSHKEVVNALYQVYHDLGTLYVQKHYFVKMSTKIKDEATKKIRDKYNLDNAIDSLEPVEELIKT